MNEKIILGCIADDFTGAGDAASFIARAGLKTVLYNGIPKKDAAADADAVVIALKTRTEKTGLAVEESLKAVEWLQRHGTEHFYSKYCSTFDSTPEGNIGPVLDAVLEKLNVKYSILCPALPVNGRTVENGILYVNGKPLAESSMRYHPLTPMRESSVKKLMEPQSKYPCIELNREELGQPEEMLKELFRKEGEKHEHFYVIPDHMDDSDAERIAELFGGLKVLSGGSALLTALGEKYMQHNEPRSSLEPETDGKAIILAGSCSEATRRQILEFREAGYKAYKIDPQKLLSGKENSDTIWERVKNDFSDNTILLYSSDTPQNVKEIQAMGKEKIAGLIEKCLSDLAVTAKRNGAKRIIVAGGETSGAVTKALDYSAYQIGESVAPGVPIMIPLENPEVRLILKSGNFGAPDFFLKALELTGERKE